MNEQTTTHTEPGAATSVPEQAPAGDQSKQQPQRHGVVTMESGVSPIPSYTAQPAPSTQYTLAKPARKGIVEIWSRLMPPDNRQDKRSGEDRTFLRGVCDGRQRTVACDKSMFVRVNGRPKPGGAMHGNMDAIYDVDFRMLLEVRGEGAEAEEWVVGIDLIPKETHNFAPFVRDPEDNEADWEVHLEVNSNTGEFRVRKVAPKLIASRLHEILRAVDKAEGFSPGEYIGAGGTIRVDAVAGNQVYLGAR
jgi:hypothetical protein